jgi:hypothetical protein
VLEARGRKTFHCNACHQQTSLLAVTLFEGAKLALTVWYLAIFLISHAKTGVSALALKRDFGGELPHGLADPPNTDGGHGETRGWVTVVRGYSS